MLKERFHAYEIVPKFYIQLKYILLRKWVWSGNTTIAHCRPTQSSVRESHRTITVTRQQKDKQSKAFNSLFPIKMIAKFKRPQSTAQQNMEQKQNPNNGSNNKMSRGMRFPTMWYVQLAKPQISLRIRAVWSEPLLGARISYECLATDWTLFAVFKPKGGCIGSPECILVKMPHCWKSRVTAKMIVLISAKLDQTNGTSNGTNTHATINNCTDTIDNCAGYGRDVCTDFADWARQRCSLYCGFCQGKCISWFCWPHMSGDMFFSNNVAFWQV